MTTSLRRSKSGDRSTHHYSTTLRTYNLTVQAVHTYFVMAGRVPILVHNRNCPRSSDGKFAKRNGEAGRDGAAEELVTWEQLELDGAPVVPR